MAANTALTALFFVIASKSLLIPSGIPVAIQEPLKILFPKPSLETSVKPIIPPSSVYNSLAAEANKSQARGGLIVLIVLESFGLTDDKTINQFILSTIERAIKPALKVRGYSIARLSNDLSLGGTLGAEVRYLCNLQTSEAFASYKEFSSSQKPDTSKCLPRLIRRSGGSAIYIHNGSKRFYNRDQIMKMIGFNRNYFQASLRMTKKIVNCLSKPFCEDDQETFSTAEALIASSAGRQTKANLFIQIMTIDTHAPYLGHRDISLSYKNRLASSAALLEKFLARTLNIRKNQPTVILLASDHRAPLGTPTHNIQGRSDLPKISHIKLDNFVYMISN